MSLAGLDAVTIDAYGTLVELDHPVDRLCAALAERGVDRSVTEVRAAFATEIAYYAAHKLGGRDAESLADLRQRCAAVFVRELGHPELEFTAGFLGSLVFAPLPGVPAALASLRALGLELAVVSDWDVGLHDHLAALGLAPSFSAIVTSAEVGAPKPDPAVFRAAVELLGVDAGRALHVGDEDADRDGAAAAGMRFAPAPLTALLEEPS